MPRFTDNLELTVCPGFVQLPGVVQRTNDVVATMHDDAWQVRDLVHVTKQLIRLQKRLIDEVMALDTGVGDGEGIDVSSEDGCLLLFGHADPIGEPMVAHGPFVMNTREEIVQAIRDHQAGRF